MTRIIKLEPDELEELKHRALLYSSKAAQLMTLHTAEDARTHFVAYHQHLANKYGYDPRKANFSYDGTVTITTTTTE